MYTYSTSPLGVRLFRSSFNQITPLPTLSPGGAASSTNKTSSGIQHNKPKGMLIILKANMTSAFKQKYSQNIYGVGADRKLSCGQTVQNDDCCVKVVSTCPHTTMCNTNNGIEPKHKLKHFRRTFCVFVSRVLKPWGGDVFPPARISFELVSVFLFFFVW